MSKKFVKVFGLHNIFNASGSTLDITSIKSSVSNKVDGDSIVFITADQHDVQYGYPNNAKYIWTHNEIYPTNDASFIVNSSSGKYLDISVNGYTVAHGVKIADISTATVENDGLASAYNVQQYVDDMSVQINDVSTNYRPLLTPNKASNDVPSDDSSTKGAVYFINKAFVQPSSGNIYSQGYIGVGKTSLNTGCNMVYNSVTNSLDFEF